MRRYSHINANAHNSHSNVIYTVCLVVFLLMAYRASTFEKEILYDPFEVLELSQVRAAP